MTFTSPSAVNRGNKLHIGPGYYLQIIVNEYAMFSFLQQVSLLIPTFSIFLEKSTLNHAIPNKIECIDVERVVTSCYSIKKNATRISVPGFPKTILSCTIKDVIQEEKLITFPSSDQGIAIVSYSYAVKINYLDNFGDLFAISQPSGTCKQKVFFPRVEGFLDIKLNLNCISQKICLNSLPIVP